MEKVDILGVKVSKVNYQSAIEIIEGFLTDGKKHYVVTPNPEFLVLAQTDQKFRQILNQADLAIPDGVGLRVGTRVTGTDLMIKLCELAAKKGYSVFLLGGRDGVAEEAAKRLKERFANLNIIGTYEGDPGEVGAPSGPRELHSINVSLADPSVALSGASGDTALQTKPSIDLLFVAYGAPKQEKWMAKNLSQIPVRVAMGVGGAFDFIAGKRKRAPKLLRRSGLEWFWRLIQEPLRLPRILNATLKFPLLVFLHKLKSPDERRG